MPQCSFRVWIVPFSALIHGQNNSALVSGDWLHGMDFLYLFDPGKDIPSLFPYQDIVYHGIAFLILAYFFARALKNTYNKITARQLVIITLLFGMMYGVSDEFHQVFTPNRTASGFDVFVDSIGTFIGGLIWRLRI